MMENQTKTTTPESKDSLSREDEIALAGLELDRPLQIEQKYQIKDDAPNQTPLEEKPLARSLFIYGMTGLGVLLLVGIWYLMAPKKSAIEVVETTPEPEETAPIPEVDYRGKLALRDQKHELEQLKKKPLRPEPQSSAPEPVPTGPPPQPQPVPPPRANHTPPPSRVKSIPAPVKTEPPEKVDPFERWNQLSSFGQGVRIERSQLAQTVNTNLPSDIAFSETDRGTKDSGDGEKAEKFISLKGAADYRSKTTPTAISNRISSRTREVGSTETMSAGTRGILNRQRAERISARDRQIAFGTAVRAEVSTPLIWEESLSSSEQLNDRFALTLTEDLLDGNETVVLPQGTVVIAQSNSVSPDNRAVNASAIAVVYRDSQGRIKQQPIPANQLIITGENHQPLIAKGFFARGGDYAATDLLVSSLSGLAKVGKVFTEPDTSTSIVSNVFGSSSTTVTNNSSREVWAAVLDSFFNPLAERISERSLSREAELEKQPNIAMLEVGTRVSIVATETVTIESEF
jgi:hypothetical protein